jgi:hypothetical protein
MGIYINGTGTISPQKTFGSDSFLEDIVAYDQRFSCIEPDYAGWIDLRAIRRMSRIIRMGVASALMALKEAGVKQPDAIITGTAYGCLEDTGIFLSKMIEQEEQALNPTPFIQSTHNTIGSQIALLLQCYGYNQTYVHRAFSFESSLLDAIMMIREQESMNILVGGVDETTDLSYTILKRFGMGRQGNPVGEGAAYFVLSGKRGENSFARLVDVAMLYKPDSGQEVKAWIKNFLHNHALGTDDLDLVLWGENSNTAFYPDLFENRPIGLYKHLCGEFPTASAFAFWVAAEILRTGKIPESVVQSPVREPLQKILIYNPYFRNHHSLILVESC